METRELYKQKYEAQLKEWEAKLEAVHAHAQKSAAQAQLDLKPHLDAFKTKYETAKTKLTQVAQATETSWKGARTEADHAWHDLKASVEGALAAMKSHQTPTPEAKPETTPEAKPAHPVA